MQTKYSGTMILNRQTLQSLLNMLDVNQAIEDAFLAYGNGQWEVPAKIIFPQAQYDGDFGAMPAYCHEPEYIAVKCGGGLPGLSHGPRAGAGTSNQSSMIVIWQVRKQQR